MSILLKKLSSFFTGKSHVKFFQNDKLENIFEKSHRSIVILKNPGSTPQLVANFTPIRKLLCTFLYLCYGNPRPPPWNIWEWKNLNQKWIHICNAKCYAECYIIYVTKKVLKENTARARLARVWIYKGNPFKIFPSASIFQRNPFKNFFHLIFFPGKSLVKNSNFTFNFTWKSF